MKQVVTEKFLREYYGVEQIEETEEGFELYDNHSGLVFVLPRECYKFNRQEIIDPKGFLSLLGSRSNVDMNWSSWTVSDVLQKLNLKVVLFEYLCGSRVEKRGDLTYFYPCDFLAEVDDIKATLVKMCWDEFQGISNYGWSQSLMGKYGESLLYKSCTDDNN